MNDFADENRYSVLDDVDMDGTSKLSTIQQKYEHVFNKYYFDGAKTCELLEKFLVYQYWPSYPDTSSITTVQQYVDNVPIPVPTETEGKYKFGYHIPNSGFVQTGKRTLKSSIVEVVDKTVTICSDKDYKNAIIVIYDGIAVDGVIIGSCIYNRYQFLPPRHGDRLANARMAINTVYGRECLLEVNYDALGATFKLFRNGKVKYYSGDKRVPEQTFSPKGHQIEKIKDETHHSAYQKFMLMPFTPNEMNYVEYI
uniref:Glutamine amidotransferase type-2 domain-containing protein n=1 Tax=Panagrellus redivivus TaxID=6233 RepID=A0A7E4WA24_PANRE